MRNSRDQTGPGARPWIVYGRCTGSKFTPGCCSSPTHSPLRKQLGHWLGFDEFAGLVEVVIDDRVGIDPDGVINGGNNIDRMRRILQRSAAGGVALTVGKAPFDSRPGQHRRVTIGPVIAAIVAVAVAAGADA